MVIKGHVFMRSYRMSDENNPMSWTGAGGAGGGEHHHQTQVLVLNAERKNTQPSRFVDSVQKTFTISYEPTVASRMLPKFEQTYHSFPLLNTIPAKSTVLGNKRLLATTSTTSTTTNNNNYTFFALNLGVFRSCSLQ